MTPVYMLLGLALVGGLYWALTQFTVRQRRLMAELSRLEQLTAEVSMNAEAVMERVDERTERLLALVAVVEARADAALSAVASAEAAPASSSPVVSADPAPVAPSSATAPAAALAPVQAPSAAAPAPAAPAAKKGGRAKKQPAQAAEPPAVQAPAAPLPEPAPPGLVAAPASPAAPTAEQSPPPAPSQRYQELRTAVWALVDQGKEPAAIAHELGLPRGEVLLLINLRSKKVTA